jgi:hypothetical protein
VNLVIKKQRVAIESKQQSFCAADARSAQHGCNGPSRRRGHKPRARKEHRKISYIILVIKGYTSIHTAGVELLLQRY